LENSACGRKIHGKRQVASRQQRHAGRVEEHRAGVLGHGRGTGVGIAQAARIAFQQLEGGGVCRSRAHGADKRREHLECNTVRTAFRYSVHDISSSLYRYRFIIDTS
jgi:hypothetical protein